MTSSRPDSKSDSAATAELFQGKLAWMRNPDIRPYVFVRPENRISRPGRTHAEVDWFPHEVIYKNPLEMNQVEFADHILHLEASAFGPSGMAMPRWVFYDCAIVPGFVAGFAARTSSLSPEVRKILGLGDHVEWAPLSLFIIIPTMSKHGEWVAHNLCSVNALLPKADHYYGIGFLSKAFGLWYANVRTCCGMTQWASPAIRLHSNYGDFEVLTAYTPIHSYARTLTYRLTVRPERWWQFFAKTGHVEFAEQYKSAGFKVDPLRDESLIEFQGRLERSEGPFYLSAQETLQQELTKPLTIFRGQHA
jgi:hypothetical protein